jgi:hypothetical protein
MPLSANAEVSAGSPPTKQYFTDSYVFNWKNQTFRADLILISPFVSPRGYALVALVLE